MQRLREITENSRVAIIGPSPHLVGLRLGKIIDDYDVIARVNDIIPVGRESDYGSRTDIVFHGCGTRDMDQLARKMRESISVTNRIELFVCPGIKAQHDWGGDVTENFQSINEHRIPFEAISKEKYAHYTREVGTELNSGIMSILLLLENMPKSLFITGFSFYFQGNQYDKCYYDGYVEDCYRSQHFNPWTGHKQAPQQSFFINHILTKHRDTVIIDSYMRNLLNLRYENVFELEGIRA